MAIDPMTMGSLEGAVVFIGTPPAPTPIALSGFEVCAKAHPGKRTDDDVLVSEGMVIYKSFDRPETMVPLRCDVHPWMRAYIRVLGHPYFAVTGADGKFAIPDVPPGDYTVEVWHERLGRETAGISLSPREAKTLTFTFK